MPAVLSARNAVTWMDFSVELDAWSEFGRCADFWWRDDDATKPGAALDQLLQTANTQALALAVIPTGATSALADRLKGAKNVTVLQHGFSHTTHAPETEKKAEFGPHRPLAVMMSEIDDGRARLDALFGNQFLPVFVPPWNRISEDLPAALASRGYYGLSCFGQHDGASAPHRLNCHIDIINWRGNRGFAGAEFALECLIDQLATRRINGSKEPIGFLTHHLDHDAAGWRFIEDLLAVTQDHPAVAWRSATEFIAES